MRTILTSEWSASGMISCKDYDPETFTLYTLMPDCSNVEPCATSTCQSYPRFDGTASRGVLRFPECADDLGTGYTFPTVSAIPSLTPSISISPSISHSPSTFLPEIPCPPEATEFFVRSITNYTNVYDLYWDCTCTGNSTFITLACSLQNHCFYDEEIGVEVCANNNRSFDMVVSQDEEGGNTIDIERAEGCIEFLKNGPLSGPLCHKLLYR